MATKTLVCIIVALVLLYGCIGGSSTVADIGNNISSQGMQPNTSGSAANQTSGANNTPASNAPAANATLENATGNVSQPGQCAQVSAPGQAEYSSCTSQSKVMIGVKDIWNCTTSYKCMNASEKLAYELSRMQGPECQDIPDIITNGLADECGTSLQMFNVTMENGCITQIDCIFPGSVANGSGS